MADLSPVLKQATPVVATRGEGVYLYDEDDRRYLDFTAGIGVTSTGHCHPRVVAAAQEQVGKLIHGQYTTVLHQPLLTLVERLGEVLPPGLDRMFFANSGSEAIEAALRLARQATGRPNVIVFHGGFHGRTVAAASMTTSGTKFRSGFAPLMAGVQVSPFPDPGHFGWGQEEKLVENAAVRGAQLKDALRGVADRFKQITDVRGLGLMIGNEFRDAEGQPSGALATAAQREAAERGLLLLTCGAWGQVVRFIPALVVGEQDVEEAAQIWSDAVGAVLG